MNSQYSPSIREQLIIAYAYFSKLEWPEIDDEITLFWQIRDLIEKIKAQYEGPFAYWHIVAFTLESAVPIVTELEISPNPDAFRQLKEHIDQAYGCMPAV